MSIFEFLRITFLKVRDLAFRSCMAPRVLLLSSTKPPVMQDRIKIAFNKSWKGFCPCYPLISYPLILFTDAREDIMNKYPPGYMDNLGFSYDLESIMQYRKDAFAKRDDLVTMEAKSDPNMVLGNMNAMSASDIMKINKLFNCAGKNEVCKYNTIHENMQNAIQCNAKCNAMQKYNAV